MKRSDLPIYSIGSAAHPHFEGKDDMASATKKNHVNRSSKERHWLETLNQQGLTQIRAKKKSHHGSDVTHFVGSELRLEAYYAFVATLVRSCQLLTTLLSTRGQYRATFGCSHALAESVLVSALRIRRLVCSFLCHISNVIKSY